MRRLETPGYKAKYGLFYELETLGNTLGTGQTTIRSRQCLAAALRPPSEIARRFSKRKRVHFRLRTNEAQACIGYEPRRLAS